MPVLAGIDEVGRGCIAGPVVACAVILDPELDPSQFKDSKALSEDKRESLYKILQDSDSTVIFHAYSASYIDKNNILKATLSAMKECILKLPFSSKELDIKIDGNKAPHLPGYTIETIIKGDSKVAEIAAASIAAKVFRDRIMSKCDSKYPGYHFIKHKGYGTQEHYDELFKLGPCPLHRRSFNLTKQETLF